MNIRIGSPNNNPDMINSNVLYKSMRPSSKFSRSGTTVKNRIN